MLESWCRFSIDDKLMYLPSNQDDQQAPSLPVFLVHPILRNIFFDFSFKIVFSSTQI